MARHGERRRGLAHHFYPRLTLPLAGPLSDPKSGITAFMLEMLSRCSARVPHDLCALHGHRSS
ncbi:MAG: hypothetical protein ACLSAH_17020 [Bilophila wadsworthia]